MKEAKSFMNIGSMTNKFKVLNTFIVLAMMGGLIWLFTHPIGGSLSSNKSILAMGGIIAIGVIIAVILSEKARLLELQNQKELLELQMDVDIQKQKTVSVDNAMKEVTLYVEKAQKGDILFGKGEKILFGQYVYGKIRVRSGKTYLDIYIDDVKDSSRFIS